MLDKIKGCLFYKKNELKDIKESVVEMKEYIKNIQESIVVEESNKVEDSDDDQVVVEKVKYCRYLIHMIHTKAENKKKGRDVAIICIILFIALMVILAKGNVFDSEYLLTFFNKSQIKVSSNNVFAYIKDVIVVIEIPLVMYIFTDANTNINHSKHENETRINEFIRVAMPLYCDKTLDRSKYMDVKVFYEKILKPYEHYKIESNLDPNLLKDIYQSKIKNDTDSNEL